jgi:hypothetical protein
VPPPGFWFQDILGKGLRFESGYGIDSNRYTPDPDSIGVTAKIFLTNGLGDRIWVAGAFVRSGLAGRAVWATAR